MDWKNFNHANILKAFPPGNASLILLIRRDGRAYTGVVGTIAPDHIVIANGHTRQRVDFDRVQWQFVAVTSPPRPNFRLGDPRLKLEGQ